MKLRIVGLAALVLLLFGGAMLWMLPAEVALRFHGDRIEPLRLHGVTGTVWDGRALGASVLGQPLGALRWRLQRLPALGGTLRGELALDGPAANGSGQFSQRGDTLTVHDARFEVPARLLQPVLAIPALGLLGNIEVEIAHALLRDGIPEQLEGNALWRDAAVTGAAAAGLGDIAIDFASQPGGVGGSVRDSGSGPLLIDGAFRIALTGYRVEVLLRQRTDNPQLAQALQWLGERQPDGSVRFLAQGGLVAW